MEDIQQVRKALKQWESAFYIVNQRKPDKNDIAQASDDVQKKYRSYADWKKKSSKQGCSGKELDTGLKSPEPTQGEVWGVELNKNNQPSTSGDRSPESQQHSDEKLTTDSLDKLGSKLFKNFSKSKSTKELKKPSFLGSPYIKKTNNNEDTNSCSYVTDSKQSSELCKDKSAVLDCYDSNNTDDGFVLKGAAFNVAQKAVTSKHKKIPFKQHKSFISAHIKPIIEHNTDENPTPVLEYTKLTDKEEINYLDNEQNARHVKNFESSIKKNSDIIRPNRSTHSAIDQSVSEKPTSELIKTVKKYPESTTNIVKDQCSSKKSMIDIESATVKKHTSMEDSTKSDTSKLNINQRKKDTYNMPDSPKNNTSTTKIDKTKDFPKEPVDIFPEEKSTHVTEQPKAKSRPIIPKRGSFINKLSEPVPSIAKEPVYEFEEEDTPIADEVDGEATPEAPKVKAMYAGGSGGGWGGGGGGGGSSRKRSAASMNENFVALNMKRKGYKRKGGAGLTSGQLRKKQWKNKMSARSESYGSNKCFKCGGEGHWANKCKGKQTYTPGAPPGKVEGDEKSVPVDEGDFPTLREAAMMSQGIKDPEAAAVTPDPDDISDLEAAVIRERDTPTEPPASMPAFSTDLEDMPSHMRGALKDFGFSDFKPGQEQSITRILKGLSTLVVLSTGGGKSLCYQIPAYLYGKHSGAITLVISPLVSLMEDQITGLPDCLTGACLHSNMTPAQRDGVITRVKEGKVHFLLVSPEAIVESRGAQGSLPIASQLPPIAFACIDEAHCLSEWSHNFRPSYLRLCKVLRRRYGVRCILGLTATATLATAHDVTRHLGIGEGDTDATVRGAPVPKNLVLSVSRDEDKDEALIQLLQGDRFHSCASIIIYCSRREQTARVATLIRTNMQKKVELSGAVQPPPAKKRRGAKKKVLDFDPDVWTSECYHAGLPAATRRRVQKQFMAGHLRVVAATVAFGMGLDKADVRAVIHYSLARSFESYVQEIGRAGRDGLTSHCHVFLDPQDATEHRRHTHGNAIDRVVLKRLVRAVFPPCKCTKLHEGTEGSTSATPTVCGGHERAVPIESTVQWLDVGEAGLATLLCYLELSPQQWVESLNPCYAHAKIQCYGGPGQLQQIAKKCPPIGVTIARQKLEGATFSDASTLEFKVVDVCDLMGWDSGTVKRELRNLMWEQGPNGWRKTGVMVEFSELAFHFHSRGDLSDTEMDLALDTLHTRVKRQERTELRHLALLMDALNSVSHKNYWFCSDTADEKRSDTLKGKLFDFFDTTTEVNVDEEADFEEPSPQALASLTCDIRAFISTYGTEHSLTGRAVARVMHGIPSPCFPAQVWGRVRRFWRAHLHIDFIVVLREAQALVVALKCK